MRCPFFGQEYYTTKVVSNATTTKDEKSMSDLIIKDIAGQNMFHATSLVEFLNDERLANSWELSDGVQHIKLFYSQIGSYLRHKLETESVSLGLKMFGKSIQSLYWDIDLLDRGMIMGPNGPDLRVMFEIRFMIGNHPYGLSHMIPLFSSQFEDVGLNFWKHPKTGDWYMQKLTETFPVRLVDVLYPMLRAHIHRELKRVM